MKKSILVIMAAFGLNALIAQTNTGVDNQTPGGVNTPATVTNKFKTDNPNVSANWSMEGDNYSAAYRDPLTNLDRIIVYNRNGNVMYSDYELDYATYPKQISDYYVSNFPKDKNYKVWSRDENGKVTYYGKRSSGKIDWFDKDGNYTTGGAAKMANHKAENKK